MSNDQVLANHDVIIEDGKIVSIEPSGQKVSDNIIDGSGKFLMPGLFDAHAHMDSGYAPLFLMNGVTAVRDCGNDDTIFEQRADAENGKVLSPRLFVSGKIIEGDPPMWSEFKAIKNISEGKQAVKELKERNADQIKLYHTLPTDLYKSMVKEARKAGLRVAGHIPYTIPVIEALDLGVQCIEHITMFSEFLGEYDYEPANLSGYDDTWRRFKNPRINQQNLRALCEAFKRNDAYHCPTLIVEKQLAGLADYTKLTKETDTSLINQSLVKGAWNPNSDKAYPNIKNVRPLWFENFGVVYENLRTILPELAKSGTLLTGSDTCNPFVIPGSSLIQEVELLADSGLSNFQALQAATVNPAKYLEISNELGELKIGSTANLIMLNANPLEDVTNLRKLDGVFIQNSYYSQKSLASKAKPVG